MRSSSTSTAPNNEISSAGSRKSSSTTGPSRFSLKLLIRYIENVLFAITNRGLDCTKLRSGTELRDLVQPLASDFSKLFEGISEGAKMFSDQSRLSSEAHSMAVDVLKGLGNAHWVAVGLLAIANVLERFDNISANDRECIDLLKDMLKLGKYLKQMKDLNVRFHKEVLDDMREAVHLILSGAILCRSFITSNKLSKFLLTKKIRDELVYVRGKINSMKADLQGHVQLLMMKTLTFIREQCITGRNEDSICLGITGQYQSEDTQCEIKQRSKTELDGSESDTLSSQGQHNEINEYKQLQMPLRSSFQLRKFLRKIIPTIFRRGPKFSLNLELQMLVKKIQPSRIEFKFDELNKATKGFSHVQLIGKGGFGSVYSGILSDGRRVAVKVMRGESRQVKREWVTEIFTLTKLQHRNIVELVGYCFHNMMLIYEYMPQSLERVIYGKDEMIIHWPTRQNIIVDIIRGLTYLHEGPPGCIVHRDIKPSNILLDENMNAKISDFGIARILQSGNSQYVFEIPEHGGNAQHANKEISIDGADVFDKTHLTTAICGTLGYIAPECLHSGRVTLKSDIFSFGMLLLSVVSGKRGYELMGEGLRARAWRLHKEDRLTELIDPRLVNTESLINFGSILRTINIALWCVMNPEMRPSASRVLQMLSSEEEIPIPPTDQSFDESHSEDEISPRISSGESCIAECSVADEHSSEQEIPIPTSPVGGNFSEEMILSPTLPLCLSSTDYNFSQEENWVPTPPIKSFVSDDHYSEEEIPTPIPPVESSEEENLIASPLVKSVVAYDNSLVKNIEESDRKWSSAYLVTLRMLCLFAIASFICLSRMFTNVSPL